MEPKDFYDKYAALIYGSIYRLTTNKIFAEKIFIEAFISELHVKPADKKEGILFTICLLRRVYQFTVKRLLENGIKPDNDLGEEDTGMLDIIFSKCNSITEVAILMNISEEEVKLKLRSLFLALRNKQLYANCVIV